jgi:hypothetical protein
MDELERIEGPTYEEIIPGDFVWLASGSPLGIVSERDGEFAAVTWLTELPLRQRLPWICLRQAK